MSEAEFEELSAQDHEEKALWKELQEVCTIACCDSFINHSH